MSVSCSTAGAERARCDTVESSFHPDFFLPPWVSRSSTRRMYTVVFRIHPNGLPSCFFF
eukprot:CAMPEP_0172372234 /NCGR_PEP_ID=MMETSP1060-20121228/46613_1 /TAXON_ID=37318 /ORGANISM="Pseudo-nitzschia pungens, Strain cf. cingulata" /LENGTH=58 /DNA_ID=CAMNT_0013098139 /DNA_START=19 /DNA_END=192 /DNA_ORIENTATION=-